MKMLLGVAMFSVFDAVQYLENSSQLEGNWASKRCLHCKIYFYGSTLGLVPWGLSSLAVQLLTGTATAQANSIGHLHLS